MSAPDLMFLLSGAGIHANAVRVEFGKWRVDAWRGTEPNQQHIFISDNPRDALEMAARLFGVKQESRP